MQNTPTSFLFIFVFSIQLIARINFADDWIRTTDLWCRMRPLYQLHHNHFPTLKQVPKRRLKNCLSDVGQNSVSLHGAEQQYFTPILQTHSLSLSFAVPIISLSLSHTHSSFLQAQAQAHKLSQTFAFAHKIIFRTPP